MLKSLIISNLNLKSNLILAPMAGITNYPFRKIIIENGCDLVITEMVSSKSLFYKNKKSLDMIEIRDDRPICIQIFGGDVQSMVYAASLIEEKGADMIEINAGCPVKKVIKAGAGISLMKEPLRLAKIVSEIKKRIKIPLSVKMRAGINSYDECIDVAKICEDSGADIIHIHARLASQQHGGPVNLDIVKKLKEILKIPLIANGGIKTPMDAENVLTQTNADAISIGQGAIINPFIFQDIKDYFYKKTVSKRTIHEKVITFIRYLKLSYETIGEKNTLSYSRKIVGMWLSRFPDAKSIRNRFMTSKSFSQSLEILEDLANNLKHS